MVCVRCKMAVEAVLKNLAIDYLEVQLGKVVFPSALSAAQLVQFSAGLLHYKLELLDNRKKILAERIKTVIIELFENPEKELLHKFSEYLSIQLHYDYTYMANVFSEKEGITIERFYISHRIEKVKELMYYEDISIKEISYRLHFSSVAHLSQQFKKVTGITPAAFRKLCASEDFVWRICE